MPRTSDTASRPYHHGDLAEALLQAAGELLAEAGPERFSMRECARRAGVSHAAPAHHFGDTRGLLTAYAAQGFEALAERLHKAAGSTVGAVARLQALGEAYVAFALEHPARYQLMFRSGQTDMDMPLLSDAARMAWAELAQAVAAARGTEPARDSSDPHAALAWSTVHGLALLLIDGRMQAARARPGAWRSVARNTLAALAPAWQRPPSEADASGTKPA